jgi:protein-S-isoprenylcysteine O-methyltransferase Ste14
MAIGTLRGLAAVGLALIGFLQRANVEEAFLTKQFGARYAEYKREVKKIIPLVW